MNLYNKTFYLFFLFFISLKLSSQTVSTYLEKDTIALGEPNTFIVKIANLDGKDVQTAPKNKLLPFHLEVLSDSIVKREDYYERTVKFSIYDEGKFQIPSLDVNINGEVFHTTPYEIDAIIPKNIGNNIADIMQNKEVKLGFRDYWDLYKFYVLAAFVVIALGILIFAFFRYFRKQKSSPKVNTNKTLKELDVLKKKKYIENGDYRSFYVRLLEITRNFLSQQYKIPADVLLTDDLIYYMKHHNETISEENEKIVEEVFLRGDNVKFAKIFPDKITMQEDFDGIKNFVNRSIKDIEFENLRKNV